MRYLLLFLLIPSIAFAQTAETQYVDWSAGCGGNDGTVGNPYCSCAEWEAQNRNLVTEDKIVTVEFTGTGTGSITCTHDGWTTDATRRTILDGLRISTSDTGAILTISDDYVTLTDFSIDRTTVGGINVNTIVGNNNGTVLDRGAVFCSGACTRSSGTALVFMQRNTGWVFTMRNTMIYNTPYTAFEIGTNTNMTINLEGNTVVNNTGTGLNVFNDGLTGVTINLYNNLATGNTTDYSIASAPTYNHATNISGDATSPDTSGCAGGSTCRSKTITYISSTDRHLDLGETDAIDIGTTRGTYTLDVDGDSRPEGSAYDIGADEVVPTPTPTPTPTATPTVTARKGQRCSAAYKGQCLQ